MLAEVVREAARRWDDRSAFVASSGWALSYRDLDRLSDEVAVGMRSRGVREGDVVALVLPAWPEYVIAYCAAAKLGAITAGVNPRLTAPEQSVLVAQVSPRLTLVSHEVPDLVTAKSSTQRIVVAESSRSEEALSVLRENVDPHLGVDPLGDDPQRRVAIVFTSGTTGTPKAALFGETQIRYITQIDTGGQWGPGGATLSGTALGHLGPTTKLAGNLMRGSTIHLMTKWRANSALDLVEQHRMNGLGGIPTQIALMMREPDFAQRDLSSVQAIVIGGGPATPRLVREARAGFGAALSVRYSCTEAGIGLGTAFDAPPEDAEVSVGTPHDGVRVLIVDEQLDPVPLGTTGEICLGSPAVMTEYWNDPAATSAARGPQSTIRTGDMGYIDELGRVRLAGRSKEMYVRGGYNVFPGEVERVLAEHPGVADIAVAARPDDVMGEIGVAVIVASNTGDVPSLAELRSFGEATLARHKLPEDLLVVTELPLTPMEKLDRIALHNIVS